MAFKEQKAGQEFISLKIVKEIYAVYLENIWIAIDEPKKS